MKKTLARMLVLCFFFAFALPFVGEEEVLPPIYMKSSLNAAGDNLTVELYTDGKKWTAIDVGLKFDPALLRLESVSVGSKILTAIERKGYDFITMHRDLAPANQSGFCNFVAAVGNETCDMTRYGGPVVVYTFAVTDGTKARASLEICLATLVDKDGNALLDYTSYRPSDDPVPYESHEVDLFRYGDLNRNGIDVFDAMMIMQNVVGSLSLDDYQTAAAKVSGGETVTVFDAMMIMQYVVGTVTSFPAEQ